jgi:hypothetical protein
VSQKQPSTNSNGLAILNHPAKSIPLVFSLSLSFSWSKVAVSLMSKVMRVTSHPGHDLDVLTPSENPNERVYHGETSLIWENSNTHTHTHTHTTSQTLWTEKVQVILGGCLALTMTGKSILYKHVWKVWSVSVLPRLQPGPLSFSTAL